MPIRPEERTQNVKASLYTYLSNNFTTTGLQFEGLPFDEQNREEWVRADMIISAMDYFRHVDNTSFGGDLIVMLNLNVMIKSERVLSGNMYRKEQLADELKHIFRIPLGITVHDHFASPTTVIGVLRTTDIEDVDLGYDETNAMYQHNVTSTMFYLSKWDGPS